MASAAERAAKRQAKKIDRQRRHRSEVALAELEKQGLIESFGGENEPEQGHSQGVTGTRDGAETELDDIDADLDQNTGRDNGRGRRGRRINAKVKAEAVQSSSAESFQPEVTTLIYRYQAGEDLSPSEEHIVKLAIKTWSRRDRTTILKVRKAKRKELLKAKESKVKKTSKRRSKRGSYSRRGRRNRSGASFTISHNAPDWQD